MDQIHTIIQDHTTILTIIEITGHGGILTTGVIINTFKKAIRIQQQNDYRRIPN